MERIIQQVLDQYPQKVKLVPMNYPLSRHRFAREAAQAAMAANAQGKYWEFRSKLFESYRSLSNEKILEIARQLGLDMARFQADLKSAQIRNFIFKDMMEGRRIGVRGTPTVFVNGKRVRVRTRSDLMKVIEEERDVLK